MADTPNAPITIELADEAATSALAERISNTAVTGDIVALFGDLGSGKTAFARAFINARTKVPEDVPSPTFTLVQTYEFPIPDGVIPVYHFDLYRIENSDEIEELGMDDAFTDGISLIEWPERLDGRLPGNRLDVALNQGEKPDHRRAALTAYGSWVPRLQPLRPRGRDNMPEREESIKAFLGGNGWGDAARTPLTGDASFRRYERLALGGRQAMLMDAPPPQENVDAFVAIARHLKSLSFSAPDIFAKDRDNGFLIIEDLGDDTFARILAAGANEIESDLYNLAVDVLIELHGIAPEHVAPPGTETYDDKKLLDEALLLCDWTWGALFGAPPGEEISRSYQAAWQDAFGHLRGQPPTLVLRDYHVDNLMVLEGRSGIARCGLLDFQDAVLGPAAYDLASLLEDARRDIGPSLKAAMLERYFAAFPDLDRDTFTAAFAVLAAQRHAKVIGIFTRLYLRDGKPGYLEHIPRVWRLLEGALSHPALAPVADWFDAHIPAAKRIAPSQDKAAS